MIKKQNGITLIGLVITIIVLLILAAVSINIAFGDNGVLIKAKEASLSQDEAKRREDLEFILYEYNSSNFLGEANGFTSYLSKIKEEQRIEDYFYIDQLIIKYDECYYIAEKDGNYYKIKEKLETDLSGLGNSFIITSDNINDGNVEFASGNSYVVLDNVSAEDFNFEIPAGDPVTIKLLGNMTIDNKGYERSAIEIKSGAILNLYVYGNVEVNSGFGKSGEIGLNQAGAEGGYAGIHVPASAVLNLYGTGDITCIGGNAGKGGSYLGSTVNGGGAGGGGAGSGIGGNGRNRRKWTEVEYHRPEKKENLVEMSIYMVN